MATTTIRAERTAGDLTAAVVTLLMLGVLIVVLLSPVVRATDSSESTSPVRERPAERAQPGQPWI